MLSRVADNLYWFTRYLRRAENTARLVNVNSQLQLDLPRNVRFAWQPLLDTLGVQDAFRRLHPDSDGDAGEADVVRFLLLEPGSPCSLLSSLQASREALRSIRDTLPAESWERVNGLFLWLADNGERALGRRYRQELLSRVVDGCLVVSGMLTANVSRDTGFQFLRLGTALEQADMTTRIIDAGGSGLIRPRVTDDLAAFRAVQWISVLRSLEAYQMYRRQVRQRVTPALALRFLLQDAEFPRSVTYCLDRVESTLPRLPGRKAVSRALAQVQSIVRGADTVALAEHGPKVMMDRIQIGLVALHEALAEAYFRN
ncbi:MAG: alpha-E domain-containing protein [Rhodanobacter denitrificans]|uniref:Alpha-E domain-containing protein n=1 Tax=Rhodanobacter denitrificans TaxID=666685 RepID=A0A2W5KUH9_9GAMM|nr:MAG: alpha-E domain-containing protein [Rhodanobacter denitrificans]